MSEDKTALQLRMIWPTRLLDSPPAVALIDGYMLRTYQSGDEPRFYALMELAGWPGWNAEKLQPSLSRILPDGWFMAIHEASGEIVATAMSLHNFKRIHPFQGEMGWVAGDPAHAGKGLGKAVTAAATDRLISAGYRDIILYTDDFRLPALKIYLTLGYVPLLFAPEMPARWQVVCESVNHAFTPEHWMAAKMEWDAIHHEAGDVFRQDEQ